MRVIGLADSAGRVNLFKAMQFHFGRYTFRAVLESRSLVEGKQSRSEVPVAGCIAEWLCQPGSFSTTCASGSAEEKPGRRIFEAAIPTFTYRPGQ
jgi:hypothetical protein